MYTHEFKQSLVAFIDILGFTERFPTEKDICMELLAELVHYNGEHFQHTDAQSIKIRPTSTAISDSIIISIPVQLTNFEHTDHAYLPLESFLNGIAFFAYQSLKKGYFFRGAISYGEICHKGHLIAGEAYIDAVKNEKKAHYPRIILTNDAQCEIEKFVEKCAYGWQKKSTYEKLCIEKCKTDGTIYFDWIKFYKNHFFKLKTEITSYIKSSIQALEKAIRETQDISIKQKLSWMKCYLDSHLQ